MSEKTVLVIDDSATIRKLVDTHLTSAGYRVVLAPNAELGISLAGEVSPDLILLDHQLPGTTGYDVCCQLSQSEQLRQIPVVVSSTLRKKAYAEYVELSNVVDMLPKPYTEELLKTTVANAIETAAMVVSSQACGTAVPEVIDQQDDAALSGTFAIFGLRELLDFLNNGSKSGVLEVESSSGRVRFHLNKGRIQGVYSAGIDNAEIDRIVEALPESLKSLSSILKMTLGGRSCAEIDGFIQLLDQKVLDPRLMLKLLRHQAAMLVGYAFRTQWTTFRFEKKGTNAGLHHKLPLDISLLALLVESKLTEPRTGDSDNQKCCYARRNIRGQNLDRAGLSAKHMKILNSLSEPKNIDQLTECLGWDEDEIRRVLDGFITAELVEKKTQQVSGQFVVFEPDSDTANTLRKTLEDTNSRHEGIVVRDRLALQLVFKRAIPHTIFFNVDDPGTCDLMGMIFRSQNVKVNAIRKVAMCRDFEHAKQDALEATLGFSLDGIITRDCSAKDLFIEMDKLASKGAVSSLTKPPAVATVKSQNSVSLVAGGQV